MFLTLIHWLNNVYDMGFFEKIFGYKKEKPNTNKKAPDSTKKIQRDENAIRMLACGKFIKSLLDSDRYIARSDYAEKITGYASSIEYFSVLKKSGMLEEFCKRNAIPSKKIERVMELYSDIRAATERNSGMRTGTIWPPSPRRKL